MGLKFSYTLLAPVYDSIVGSATQKMRLTSLQRLNRSTPQNILINGIGTGLDIPFLPEHHNYTATDLTPAMLNKCDARLSQHNLNMKLHTTDVMQLPFNDDHFDIVLMNLILAVVPNPALALQEASRVVKPGGKIYIMDKFIKPGQLALTRRLLNLFMQHIATRTDVVFEKLLDHCPELELLQDKPALMSGWFRLIDLEKNIK
ncbi:MAG: phosphatidylethanolamine N-methyltransferase [endosymbiont of Galathealinum brachiosum]|uniref:Phosphatidylethanolamine N-methyltransferase n=1 Tax=endosymbiont of Galathealinum brachiosum TaxID=2200906 RepID=A0A370D9U2_9GAMM|nr:MAG: phosphatidylethanolamine N-methyltransferase [endosymbiont of Galathealinum brachiosum]